MEIELSCFSCSKKMKFIDRVSLREECPQCRHDVHVCKNCDFYDVKAYNECREPQAEVVREKDRANRCDYFSIQKGGGGQHGEKDKAAALRAAAEALFKKN